MQSVRFSVVIPLYNKAESVSRTLASITQQRLAPAEIIVIDDGSTDGSADKVMALNIPHLTLVKQKNQGVSAARNYGVSLANNELIAFIDADDEWSPFYLEEMSKLIARFPQQSCFASHYQKVLGAGDYRDPKLALDNPAPGGAVLQNYFKVSAEGDLPFMPSSLVITARLFKQLGGFPAGEAMGEDQALFSKIALHSSIVYSPLVLMFYHTQSENRACDRHIPHDLLPFAKRLVVSVAAGKIDKALAPFVMKYCAAHLCHLIKINIIAGNFSIARRLLKNPISQLKPIHRTVFSLWLTTKKLFSFIPGQTDCSTVRSNSL
jgi:glycosyltransferase involved in cell wall biosynthesis